MTVRSHDLLRGVEVPRVSRPLLISSLPVKRVDELNGNEQHANYAAFAADDLVLPVFHLSDRLVLAYTLASEDEEEATVSLTTFTCTADDLVARINEDVRVRASVLHGKLVIENVMEGGTYIQAENFSVAGHVSATDPRAPIFRYYAPDPRGISLRGALAAPPTRRENETSPLSAGVARYEERTSASINRGIEGVSRQVDELSDAVESLVLQRVRVPYRVDGSVVWEDSDFGRLYPLTRVLAVDSEGLPIARSFPNATPAPTGTAVQVSGEPVALSFTRSPFVAAGGQGIAVDESTVDFASVPPRRHAWAPLIVTANGAQRAAVITEWISPRRARVAPYVRHLAHVQDLTNLAPLRPADLLPGQPISLFLYASPYLDEQDSLALDVPNDAVFGEGDVYLTFQRVVDLKGSGEKADDAYRSLEPLHEAVIRARSPFDMQLDPVPIVSQHAIRNAGLGGVRVGELGAGNTELLASGRLRYTEDKYPASPSALQSNGPVYINGGPVSEVRGRRGYGETGVIGAEYIARDALIKVLPEKYSFGPDDLGRTLRVLFIDVDHAAYATITRVLSSTHVEVHVPLLHFMQISLAANYDVNFEFVASLDVERAHSAAALYLESAEERDALQVNVSDIPTRISTRRSASESYTGAVYFDDGDMVINGYASIAPSSVLVHPLHLIVIRAEGWFPVFTALSSDTRVVNGTRLGIPWRLPDSYGTPESATVLFIPVRERQDDVAYVQSLATPEATATHITSTLADIHQVVSDRSVRVVTPDEESVCATVVREVSSVRAASAYTHDSVAAAITAVGPDAAIQGVRFVGSNATIISESGRAEVTVAHAASDERISLVADALGRAVVARGNKTYVAVTHENVILGTRTSPAENAHITAANLRSLQEDVTYLNDQVVKLRLQNEALHNAAVMLSELIRNEILHSVRENALLITWGATEEMRVQGTAPRVIDNGAVRAVRMDEVFAGVQRALASSRDCAGTTYIERLNSDPASLTFKGDRVTSVRYGKIGVGLYADHGYAYETTENLSPHLINSESVDAGKTFYVPRNFLSIDELLNFMSDSQQGDARFVSSLLNYTDGMAPSIALVDPLSPVGQNNPQEITYRYRVGVIPQHETYQDGTRISPLTDHELRDPLYTTRSLSSGFLATLSDEYDVQSLAEDAQSTSEPEDLA